jgi:hypothetical protein
LAVIVVEMKVSSQFVGGQGAGIAAVALSLRGGQEVDGHECCNLLGWEALPCRCEETVVSMNSIELRHEGMQKAKRGTNYGSVIS